MWRDIDICLHGKNKWWLLENLLHKPFYPSASTAKSVLHMLQDI